MKVLYNEISKYNLDIKYAKQDKCFNFGKDNSFPSLINELANNSVTSKACFKKIAKAIYGGGIKDFGEKKANSKQNVDQVFRVAGVDYGKQNNLYVHVSFDGNYKPSSFSVVPCDYARVGDDDDNGYSGKILVYDNWEKKEGFPFNPDKFKYYDKFNIAEGVVKSQIENCKGKDLIEKAGSYKGQIMHIQTEEGVVYSKSDLEPVIHDALLEAKAAVFKGKGAEKGFLNTKILVVPPFSDEKERKAFKNKIASVKGVDNSGDVILLEVAEAMDDLSKALYMGDLSGKFNDKLFEYSEKMAEKNISKALGVPLMLITTLDAGLFANGGAALKEAKLQLFEDNEDKRVQILNAFNKITTSMEEPFEILEVINPYVDEDVVEETDPDALNKKAQAELRGSVGGVQAFASSIIVPISQGIMTVAQGRAIAKALYDFSDAQLEEMIVEPVRKDGNVEPITIR